MKQYSILLILSLFIMNVQAQDYFISFSGAGAVNSVDQVKVENLTQHTHLTLPGGEMLHLEGNTPTQESETTQKSVSLKSRMLETSMLYTTGDRLKFTGSSGNYSTVIMDSPQEDKKLTFRFVACSDSSLYSYSVVQIGTQEWMAENLKTTKLNDGKSIPYGFTTNYFATDYNPSYCYYRNSYKNRDTYGTLYDWDLVWTQKLCPNGWHVPSIDEWTTLFTYLGGLEKAGAVLKEQGTTHWISPNTGATDSVGFCALPGGENTNGELTDFHNLGISGSWWTSNAEPSDMIDAWYVSMYNDSIKAAFNMHLKNVSSSVRCVYDSEFPVYRVSKNVTVCSDSTYNGWNTAGQYSVKFTSVDGYDSIVTTNLSFYQTPDPDIIVEADTLVSLNTYKDYQWFDTNGSINGATENRYVINKSGQYYLMITDDHGCRKTSDMVNVYQTYTSQNSPAELKYSVIPNPNHGKFTFKITSAPNAELTLKVINASGQTIEIRKIRTTGSEHSEIFDLSHVNKGTYYLIITYGSTRHSEKIIIR